MTTQIAIIGALSVNEGIKSVPGIEAILAGEYPAEIEVTNFATFNLCLPEMGLFARPGEVKVITVSNPDSVHRAAVSASQIASLKGAEKLVSIKLVGKESLPEPAKQEKAEPEKQEAAPKQAAENKPKGKGRGK